MSGRRGGSRRSLTQAPVITGLALALTLVVLVVVGTQRDGGAGAGEGAAAPSAGRLSGSDLRAEMGGGQRKAAWLHKLRPGEKPPQFVLFSFDGAGSHEHWQRMLPIAKRTGGAFTAFVSGTYLIPDGQRDRYTGPGHRTGRSAIGFGGSAREVRTRIADLNAALEQGIEIGTHYNGHFCQGDEPSANQWSAASWNDELDQFFRFVRDAVDQGLRVAPSTIKGGRTPCLEGDFDILLPTLARRGMTYDSSQVSDGIAWPRRVHGVWEFPLPLVWVPALGHKVLMMDYNLWYQYNGARNDRSQAATFRDYTLATYRGAYQAALNGNRAPLVVGNHFNDWSGGAFTAATEAFMSEVCVAEDTVCATYSQVIDWMALQDPKVLQKLRAQPNAQAH